MLKLSVASVPSGFHQGAQIRYVSTRRLNRSPIESVRVNPMRRYVCVALACMAASLHVRAAELPQSGRLKLGAVGLSVHNSNAMTLHQSSQAAVIEWKSFDIAEDHTVDVRQPFHDSVLLNRVKGDDISTIAGTLRANGTVLLVNPNGVHIAHTGRIATGGFLASSVDIDNDDIHLGAAAIHHKVNGKMHDTQIARMGAVSAVGGVLNEGLIEVADGGYVSLAGTRAVHDGMITARNGHVAISGPAYLSVSGRIDLERHREHTPLPSSGISPVSSVGSVNASGRLEYSAQSADWRYFQDPLASPGSPAFRLGSNALSSGSLTLVGSNIERSVSPSAFLPEHIRQLNPRPWDGKGCY